jgi:hypothetical protein
MAGSLKEALGARSGKHGPECSHHFHLKAWDCEMASIPLVSGQQPSKADEDAWLDAVLVGAEPFAVELFGSAGPTEVRRTRHWINKGHIRAGKVGTALISTRRRLREDLARLISRGGS